MTAPLRKALSKHQGTPITLVTVGLRHVHMLNQEHGLFEAVAEGCLLLFESATYMLQLTTEQVTCL